MRATGIIRRIDDLGRVVIPKEIRRTMRIREGDPLEIYVTEGGVMFKKYQAMSDVVAQTAYDALRSLEITGCVIDYEGNTLAGRKLSFTKMFDVQSLRHMEQIEGDWYIYPIMYEDDPVAAIIFNNVHHSRAVSGIVAAVEILI